MANNPLVTIVVTCYNRADMVCTALDSIWNQTYRPIELIAVDDGSSDNSFEVIQQWHANHSDTDDFTFVAKTFPNGKLCVARNRGLELAHGEYIQYVDDDDWLYPEAMAVKMAYLQSHPGLDLLVNQLDFFCEGKLIHKTHMSLPENPEATLVHLLSHECLMSPTLMFKTETLRRIGAWTPGLIFADDMEITVRLAILGGAFGIVDKSLSGYRVHNQTRQCTTIRDRLSADFCPNLYFGLYSLAKQNRQDSDGVRQAFAQILRKDARDFIRGGRFDASHRCLAAADGIEAGGTCYGSEADAPWKIPLGWRIMHLRWRLRTWVRNAIRKFR